MKQEDKELLLKDLCARLPYDVVLYNPCANFNYQLHTLPFGIESILKDIEKWGCKPYLRPMSSITKKEIEVLEDIRDYAHTNENYAIILIDFYNSHHLDYRGLIPLGLALVAPKDMYNVKQ